MRFPNPLYSAQTAIFPVIYIETGELIDRLKTLSVPAWFAISTADPAVITDMPKNINKGFGAQGLFVPGFDLEQRVEAGCAQRHAERLTPERGCAA